MSQITKAVKELKNSDNMRIELDIGELDIGKKPHNKSFFRIWYNKLILTIQKKIVPSHLKNALLRTTGMNVARNACIPHDITFDPYFPELIYIGRACIIGGECNIKTHTIKDNKLILGKAIVGKRSLMAGLCTMEPGSKISTNSILNIHSDLDTVTGEGELWYGNPAKLMMKFSPEDTHKYFKESDGNYKEYYIDFKKKLEEFKKDKSKTYLKIYYNGNRENPGNDWFKARNVIAIFWSGVLVELARIVPGSWLRILLFRLAGAKIGKNCHIGKGVVLDHLMTPYIELEDNVRLGDYVYLDGHEYTISQTIFGRTIIKKGAQLKKGTFARIGTIVGENTIIEADSAIQREIPANEIWGGNPAKKIGDNHD